jgi:hypothetical protein
MNPLKTVLKSSIFLLGGMLFVVSAVASAAEMREWHINNDQQAVRAEAVDAKYDRESKTTLVYLKQPNGMTVTVPFPKLDKNSREYAWYDVQKRHALDKSRPFSLPPPGTVKFAAKPFSLVDAAKIPDTITKTDGKVLLGIAPRIHELGRPPEGWCGEEAIQEALEYYGVYYPQEKINEAGKPVHPDLYSNDIPRAIKNLGFEYQPWAENTKDVGAFIAWIRHEIEQGSPVLVGVKIYPTQHEEWGLDHFVLAVGAEGDSLILNTTWGFRYTLTEEQLRSTREGFSFANKYNTYYGLSIKGPNHANRENRPVRLFIEQETAERLAVIVKCENLEVGSKYSLYRLSSADEKNPTTRTTFQAKQQVYAVYDIIERGPPAIYRYQKVTNAD